MPVQDSDISKRRLQSLPGPGGSPIGSGPDSTMPGRTPSGPDPTMPGRTPSGPDPTMPGKTPSVPPGRTPSPSVPPASPDYPF